MAHKFIYRRGREFPNLSVNSKWNGLLSMLKARGGGGEEGVLTAFPFVSPF